MHEGSTQEAPNDVARLLRHAEFLVQSKDGLPAADALYLRAMQLDDSGLVAARYAWQLQNAARFDEAEAVFIQALKLNGAHTEARRGYANLLCQVRRKDVEAEQEFTRALATAPESPTIRALWPISGWAGSL